MTTAVQKSILAICAVSLLFGDLAVGEDDAGAPMIGHLDIRSPSPQHVIRPTVNMPSRESPGVGRWVGRVDVAQGNMWLYEPGQYVIDGEWLIVESRLAYGVSESISLAVGIPILKGSGGFADSLIESFHNALGIGNANREARPRNEFLIEIVGEDQVTRGADQLDWSLGDVPLYATWSWKKLAGSRFDFLVAAGLTLPTGDRDRLAGLGDPLYGVSAIAYMPLADQALTLFWGGSASYSDADEVFGIRLRHAMFSGLGGVQYHYSSRMTWIAQLIANSPVAEDYPRFSDNSYEAHLGFKRRVGPSTLLTVSFVENIFRFSNSLDVGAGASLTHFW